MKQNFLVAVFCSLWFSTFLPAQEVWPGDVNNNGVVNEVDLLFWGIAYGSSGPARLGPSADWQAYPLPAPWGQSFPSGLNYAFADCNGDGLVDEDDFDDAIDGNFGLQHGAPSADGYANAAPGNGPRLRLQPSAAVVEEGAIVDIALSLDDSDMPLDAFYGIAFTMTYSTGLLESGEGPDFDLALDSWMEADGAYVQELYHDNDGQGRAALAITRTNQAAISVEAAEMGRFSIVIEDIIVGLHIDTFHLQIDSVRLVTPGFNTIPVTPDSVEIIVAKDINLVSTQGFARRETTARQPAVEVFPNPANIKGGFFVQSETPWPEAFLVGHLGRVWPLEIQALHQGLYRLQPPALPSGIYWLQLRSPQHIVVRKIFLSP